LATGCIPHPRLDWGNAKYYGQVVDVNGKSIENALVIVKDKNYRSDVVQVTQTDSHGSYAIEPKKFFIVFGALLAQEPPCIDDMYVVHPEYEVYFERQHNRRKHYRRLCTDVDVKKDFVLRKKLRRPEDYEKISWSNAKPQVRLYNYDEQEVAKITDINKDKSLIIRYVNDGYKTQKIDEINSILFIKKVEVNSD
jgi:hypothetical protein